MRITKLTALLLFVALLLCGCGGNETPPEATTPTSTEAPTITSAILEIAAGKIGDYTIIRPDTDDKTVINLAVGLRTYLTELTGVTPKISCDWLKPGTDPDSVSEYEILIGKTNRTASSAALADAGTDGWCVTLDGNRIIINAAQIYMISEAVEYFKSICVFEGEVMKLDSTKCKTEHRDDPLLSAGLSLRVGSYNIKGGKDVGYDMSVIAADIKALDLDVVGLQEIDQLTRRNGKMNTMKQLSELSGYEYYEFTRAIDYQGGQYGTAILSKYPIASFEVIPLASGTAEQRSLGHAVLNINGSYIDFFNTHLSFEQKALRTGQFEYIAGLLASCRTYILTADFNTADTSEFNVLPGAALVNRNTYPTFPSSSSAIDNIVLSSGWSITESGMGPAGHSDHNMLWAEIKYTGQ